MVNGNLTGVAYRAHSSAPNCEMESAVHYFFHYVVDGIRDLAEEVLEKWNE